MTTKEAQQLLGLDSSFTTEMVDGALRQKSVELESKIERAPTSGLKEKYRRNLSQMEEAWEMLSGTQEGRHPDNLPTLLPTNQDVPTPSKPSEDDLQAACPPPASPVEELPREPVARQFERTSTPPIVDPLLAQQIRELECKINLAPNVHFRARYVSELEKLKGSQSKDAASQEAQEIPPEGDPARKFYLLNTLGKAVKSAPSLIKVNGFGNGLSGSMVDPDLYPKFFMLYGPSAIVPLFPTKAYLLESGKGRSYIFYKEYSFEELRKIYGPEKIGSFLASRSL